MDSISLLLSILLCLFVPINIVLAELSSPNCISCGTLDRYKIIWKGPYNKDTHPALDEQDDDVINIATKSNERYMCVVPSDNRNQLNFDTSARNSSSKTSKTKTPIQLLEPLFKGKYCSYKFELFWNYELCHGKFLRQYHEENTRFRPKVTQEYYLGQMEQELALEAHVEEDLGRGDQPRPTILVNGQHKPYVRFNMTNGTKCDLTKNSRVAKIIYVCNEDTSLELYSVKEVSTCEYEAIVSTSHLCQHKDFKVDTTTLQEIQCFSLEGAPRRPKKTIEFESVSEDDERNAGGESGATRRSFAHLQGRTLIIDADALLS